MNELISEWQTDLDDLLGPDSIIQYYRFVPEMVVDEVDIFLELDVELSNEKSNCR